MDINNFTVDVVHMSQINAGDTVLINNVLHTVSKTNIKHDKFMGYSIYGSSYYESYQFIKKVTFLKP